MDKTIDDKLIYVQCTFSMRIYKILWIKANGWKVWILLVEATNQDFINVNKIFKQQVIKLFTNKY